MSYPYVPVYIPEERAWIVKDMRDGEEVSDRIATHVEAALVAEARARGQRRGYDPRHDASAVGR